MYTNIHTFSVFFKHFVISIHVFSDEDMIYNQTVTQKFFNLNIFILILFILNTLCHKGKYTVFIERADVAYKNLSIGDFNFEVRFYNRTFKVWNIFMYYYVPLKKDSMLHLDYYTFNGNVYRLSIIQIKKPMHEVLSLRFFDMIGISESFKPNFKWPVQTLVNYTLTDYSPNFSNFPGNLPESKFKIHIKGFLSGAKDMYVEYILHGSVKFVY